MYYVVLEKAYRMIRPFTRVRGGRLERVAGFSREYQEASPPTSLHRDVKSDINKELFEINKVSHSEIPLIQVFNALKSRGIVALQEDFTPFEGVLVGREGRASLDIAPVGSYHAMTDMYKPFKNSNLILQWYRKENGNYEITSYLS